MSLTSLATNLTDTLGLGGVAAGLFINAVGIPIPSELIIPLTGVAMRQGRFNVAVAFVVVVAAQMIGLFASYALARYGGVALIHRYGRYVGISARELDRAQAAFDRRGSWLVLVGTCLPGLHGYVGYPAGIAEMSPFKFGAAAAAGVTLWSIALLWIGYHLGNHLTVIDQFMHRFAIAIILLLVVLVIWYIRRHRSSTADSSAHSTTKS